MTVKELVDKLSKCNPNAKVCVETWMDPAANKVKEYIIDDKPYVYIGDDFDELEYNLGLHDDEEEQIMDILKQKLNNEIQEFKKTYETMTSTQIYNDWYIIGFKEAYYEMLMSNFVDWDDYDYIAKWLCEFECPLQFLYSEWLSADGAFDHDWDAMFDFIEEVYRDCMANKIKEAM